MLSAFGEGASGNFEKKRKNKSHEEIRKRKQRSNQNPESPVISSPLVLQ